MYPYCQGWRIKPLTTLVMTFQRTRELLRKNADTAVIIITDREESFDFPTQAPTTALEIIEAFQSIYNDEKELIVYRISPLPDDNLHCKQQYETHTMDQSTLNTHISELVNQTHGSSYSLCLTNYTPLAKQIADDFQNQWRRL